MPRLETAQIFHGRLRALELHQECVRGMSTMRYLCMTYSENRAGITSGICDGQVNHEVLMYDIRRETLDTLRQMKRRATHLIEVRNLTLKMRAWLRHTCNVKLCWRTLCM